MNFNFPPLTPLVKKLLILLGVAFVTVAVVDVFGVHLATLLSLQLHFGDGVPYSLAWQPFTYWLIYPPVPSVLIDVFLTLLMIYFFLGPFETQFGAKRAVILCAAGILSGAAVGVALGFVLPRMQPYYGAGVISAAAFGAFPVLFRGQEIMLFPLLIKMKAWTALFLGLGLVALMAVLQKDLHVFVVYAAAMGSGVAYAKWLTRPPKSKPRTRKRRLRESGPELSLIKGGADDTPPRWLN